MNRTRCLTLIFLLLRMYIQVQTAYIKGIMTDIKKILLSMRMSYSQKNKMFVRIFAFTLMNGLPISLLSAQSVFTGNVKNMSGEPIVGTITVQAYNSPVVAGFTRSDAKGDYSICYEGKADSITLTISGMLIGKHSKTVANRSQRVDFIIKEQTLKLKEVTVNASKIRQNKDTLDFLVGAYTDQNDRVIGDVIKKMPGIEVAESGKISFNGREISKFYVENMDLLHGKYGLATNNISAKAVSIVQVLENHQPIKALRDKLPTSDVAINLKLKNSAKGTFSIMGLIGGGYQPILWNAELSAMYFGKKRQNMTIYKGNNSGDNVASEFLTHYDYERMYMNPNSSLRVQMPTTPSVPRKRYIDNHSHAVTTNHLIKTNENTEFTTNVLYYDDCIRKDGYSFYEQYLPAGEKLVIEEQLASTSHIHNAEVASRVNVNTENHYFNNALNLKASWNNDFATGNTYSNVNQEDTKIDQRLDKPFFSIDNTMNFIKMTPKSSYKLYFSVGYGQKPHSLTISPVTYLGERQLNSLAQDLTARDLGAVLRLSYGFRLKYFRLDYSFWGRADVRNLNTELNGETTGNIENDFDNTFKNNLWYNTYQIGFSQNYSYEKGDFKATIGLPFVYYILTDNDKIPNICNTHNRVSLHPTLSLKYEHRSFTFHVSGNARRSFGDVNTSYTGYIMHGYRNLLRNTADRLLENRFAKANASVSYKDIFNALFINLGINYGYSWKNLLYGYSYQGIMSIKNTIEQPTDTENYGIKLSASKGLNFWSGTLRIFGNYNVGNGQQLIQKEILDSRFRNYGAGTGLNLSPASFLSLNYSFSWSESQSYIVGRSSDFPKIRQTSQTAGLNIFPTKAITINMNVEHQYNSVAGQRYTTFADAGLKWKNKHVDIELGVNNIFNARQYVSASYSEVSTYYYSYNLRPVSALLKFRFKIK